jgi:hypothetical protein
MAKSKMMKLKLDMMSVTVLLVMSVFGGVVGYYLGIGAGAAQAVSLREAATLMKDKGALMEDAGKLLDEQGKRTGSLEMINEAKQLLEGGSVLMGKATSMMGLTQ